MNLANYHVLCDRNGGVSRKLMPRVYGNSHIDRNWTMLPRLGKLELLGLA